MILSLQNSEQENLLLVLKHSFFIFKKIKPIFKIEKDAVRTDRQIEIFQEDGSPYLQKLMEVLLIYSMFNFDLG